MCAEGERVRARRGQRGPRGRKVEAAHRLQSLLAWMALQDFEVLSNGDPSLLRRAEPIAYRWLHYEDPMPVGRLTEGVQRLIGMGVDFDGDAVDKACAEARKRGFSN